MSSTTRRTRTSAAPTSLKEGFFEHRYDTLAPEELVRVATSHEPDFAPGAGWNYSNTNYVLAGMVIEKATGRPYGEGGPPARHRAAAPDRHLGPRHPHRRPRAQQPGLRQA
ncbi:serine hydrolase [Streptomyces albogriseolus]